MRTLDVAVTQLGVKEDSGANDGIPATRYNRGDKLPWCASFALYCNAQSTDPKVATTNAEFYLFRSVAAFEAEMKRRGWWLDPTRAPQPNDFVFFGDRGHSDAGTGRHMGIVESFTAPKLTSIEGNWSNAVCRVVHDLAKPAEVQRITGFARFPT